MQLNSQHVVSGFFYSWVPIFKFRYCMYTPSEYLFYVCVTDYEYNADYIEIKSTPGGQ